VLPSDGLGKNQQFRPFAYPFWALRGGPLQDCFVSVHSSAVAGNSHFHPALGSHLIAPDLNVVPAVVSASPLESRVDAFLEVSLVPAESH